VTVAAKRTLLIGVAVLALAGAVWAAAPPPGVALRATPSARTVIRGTSARYTIVLKRTAHYGRTVKIHVSDLPRGVRVSWQIKRPKSAKRSRRAAPLIIPGRRVKLLVKPDVIGRAILVLKTSRRTPLRSFRPLVSARGKRAHAKLRLRLVVRRPRQAAPTTNAFALSGLLAGPLSPGTSQPLELTILNPFRFPLRVTTLDVAIADATSSPGCSGRANYAVVPARASYPLTVPSGMSRLSDLAGSEALPRVTMLNLLVNQDACKGAHLHFELSGSAER
jgi:hypothetical protein